MHDCVEGRQPVGAGIGDVLRDVADFVKEGVGLPVKVPCDLTSGYKRVEEVLERTDRDLELPHRPHEVGVSACRLLRVASHYDPADCVRRKLVKAIAEALLVNRRGGHLPHPLSILHADGKRDSAPHDLAKTDDLWG